MKTVLILMSFVFFWQTSAGFAQHHHEETVPQPESIKIEEAAGNITLKQLEDLALQNNPTIAQSMASIDAAEARKAQATLYPNPTIGMLSEELSQRDPGGLTGRHLFFVADQTVVLGGKRGSAREFFDTEKKQTILQSQAQKQRVLNAVRILFYQTLGVQQQLAVRERMQSLADQAAQTTRELYNVGQADQPDVLEAEIQAQSAHMAVLDAQNERERLWNSLTAVVGKLDLTPTSLAGSLDYSQLDLQRQPLLDELLEKSPQIKSAELQLQRARASLHVAKAQRWPDLSIGGGIGYNYEEIPQTGKPVGVEGFIQIGIPLPLFNRNQGNLSLAQAEQNRAEKEELRVKLELTSRFSNLFAEYQKQRVLSQNYHDELLPRARQAYELYRKSFQQMAAAYPQVLIAQRTQYELEQNYITALTNLRVSVVQLEGFLLHEGALEAPPFPALEADSVSAVSSSSDVSVR